MNIAPVLTSALLLLGASSTALGAAANAPHTPLSPGRYCLKQAVDGDIGPGRKPLKLGNLLMQVDVKKGPTGYHVEFWNELPDSQETLEGGSDKVQVSRDGSLVFNFDDGWENLGRGRVRPDGRVTLTMVKSSGHGQIGRNYGDYRVSRLACRAPEFRNP